jgi:hypothetical protein
VLSLFYYKHNYINASLYIANNNSKNDLLYHLKDFTCLHVELHVFAHYVEFKMTPAFHLSVINSDIAYVSVSYLNFIMKNIIIENKTEIRICAKEKTLFSPTFYIFLYACISI